MGRNFFPGGRKDAHSLPVIGEFPATVQANNIGAGLQGGRRAALSGLAAEGEAGALVRAAEQDVNDFQFSSYLLQSVPA